MARPGFIEHDPRVIANVTDGHAREVKAVKLGGIVYNHLAVAVERTDNQNITLIEVQIVDAVNIAIGL